MHIHQPALRRTSWASGLLVLFCSLVWTTLALAGPPAATPLSVSDALKPASVSDIHISPDGKHLVGILRKNEDKRPIVFDAETLAVRLLQTKADARWFTESVAWFNDRLLIIESDKYGAALVDLDGKVSIDAGDYYIQAIDPDADGNERFLYKKYQGAFRYNFRTQERSLIQSSQPGKPLRSIHDREGDRRVVTTMSTAFWSDDTTITHWYRASVHHPWEKLATFSYTEEAWSPLSFSKDEKSLVVYSRQGRDTYAYFRYDLKERKVAEMMAGHPTQDIGADFDNGEEAAQYVLTHGLKTEIQWFDPVWGALQRSVDAYLPGRINLMEGDPKKRVLIFSYSDRDPGRWFLLDVPKSTVRLVSIAKPEIDPDRMQPMQNVEYKARDGLSIPAYLTRPVGAGPKPTVILIHGGPHARDGWRWDPEVQMLASRGYTVFQPQFRGSGGFGKRYMEAGYGQWGLAMQDDISDGVRWLVEQGHADPSRICIYGASYGGYAAMWGLAKTPELYRCGASYAGVSDLEYMLKDYSDVNAQATGRLQRNTMFGTSAARKQSLGDVSPLKNAAAITVPVLVAHGEWDRRVPIAHSKKLVSALKKNDKEVEWMELKEEGHGIYHEKNKELFYQALFKLFDRTIGSGAPASAPPPDSTAK